MWNRNRWTKHAGAFEVCDEQHRIAGWRPALEAFLGFRHGLKHYGGRIRNRKMHPQLSDLRALHVDVHRVRAFKSEACHELLQRLAPDVTIICGTPILPESLLSIARICTLNTHTSVLPHYRGGGSLDWPLFFRDTEKIGFTIHKAVAQVDAGRPLEGSNRRTGARHWTRSAASGFCPGNREND